jgi:hypothetical protein
MSIRHSFSIGILLLILAPAVAADTEVSPYRDDCLKALRYTEELANTGTYKIRVQRCEEQRADENLDTSRRDRLRYRTEAVQERITRNSRARVQRVIPEPETETERFDRFQKIYTPQETYKRLQKSYVPTRVNTYQKTTVKPVGYNRYAPQTSKSVLTKRINYSRPSRRIIKQDALMQTRSSRFESGDTYQKELLKALDECSHISNRFHRNNCIRTEQIKNGTR